jgi:drug/metabolite transporter (DMT)-like permease
MRLYEHAFIFSTILFTVYSQLIMRWQVSLAGPLPMDMSSKLNYILTLLINPWVLSGILATFFAGISWMLAMTKFEISYAFPFVSLNYIIILFSGFLIFNESISITKILGSALVILGIVIMAKG